MADTGLLVAMLDDEAQEDLRAYKNLGVYKGALYENIAAEALKKAGCGLYYYKRMILRWKKTSLCVLLTILCRLRLKRLITWPAP